ncbi:hypothetical protein LMH87_000259 [Akanthomyces muscarius]|uniref:Uncharacterized protein n=1 Tax=Akanthomyces muscarius TaxID=2231603 RepID=A0A9W8QEZ0_AKAMU|nr:hypothetical protein LMH87_000259 [Akanthomyces muscarius]KAJ4154991.1 hypothetical protein LMH87_000259 [Akanthomyces muscarius]
MAADAGAIDTEIVYLARDEKYATEKPFTMAFSVDDVPEAAVDNHIWEAHPVQIGNARDGINPELDTHGFQFVPWETALERADFEFDEIIITRYYAELAKLVKAHFPRYKKVAFFNYAIRRRDARYPAAKGAETEAAQPFRFAHVDYTETGAKLKLQESLASGGSSTTPRPKTGPWRFAITAALMQIGT